MGQLVPKFAFKWVNLYRCVEVIAVEEALKAAGQEAPAVGAVQVDSS
jgi:hypothetical protein